MSSMVSGYVSNVKPRPLVLLASLKVSPYVYRNVTQSPNLNAIGIFQRHVRTRFEAIHMRVVCNIKQCAFTQLCKL